MTIRRLGTWLMWLGIASVAGKLTSLDIFLLIWLDSWGDLIGWALRVSIIALGYYWLKTGES